MIQIRKATCKNCGRPIVNQYNNWTEITGWYHVGTEAARCHDDASFVYAEPKEEK